MGSATGSGKVRIVIVLEKGGGEAGCGGRQMIKLPLPRTRRSVFSDSSFRNSRLVLMGTRLGASRSSLVVTRDDAPTTVQLLHERKQCVRYVSALDDGLRALEEVASALKATGHTGVAGVARDPSDILEALKNAPASATTAPSPASATTTTIPRATLHPPRRSRSTATDGAPPGDGGTAGGEAPVPTLSYTLGVLGVAKIPAALDSSQFEEGNRAVLSIVERREQAALAKPDPIVVPPEPTTEQEPPPESGQDHIQGDRDAAAARSAPDRTEATAEQTQEDSAAVKTTTATTERDDREAYVTVDEETRRTEAPRDAEDEISPSAEDTTEKEAEPEGSGETGAAPPATPPEPKLEQTETEVLAEGEAMKAEPDARPEAGAETAPEEAEEEGLAEAKGKEQEEGTKRRGISAAEEEGGSPPVGTADKEADAREDDGAARSEEADAAAEPAAPSSTSPPPASGAAPALEAAVETKEEDDGGKTGKADGGEDNEAPVAAVPEKKLPTPPAPAATPRGGRGGRGRGGRGRGRGRSLLMMTRESGEHMSLRRKKDPADVAGGHRTDSMATRGSSERPSTPQNPLRTPPPATSPTTPTPIKRGRPAKRPREERRGVEPEEEQTPAKDVETQRPERGVSSRGRPSTRGRGGRTPVSFEALPIRHSSRYSSRSLSLDDKIVAGLEAGSDPMRLCVEVWNEISAHKYSIPFRKPVRVVDAPDYFDVVKRPMDLSTVKKLMDDGTIATPLDFQREMLLICRNAIQYNPRGSDIEVLARDLKMMILQKIKPIVELWKDNLASTAGAASSTADGADAASGNGAADAGGTDAAASNAANENDAPTASTGEVERDPAPSPGRSSARYPRRGGRLAKRMSDEDGSSAAGAGTTASAAGSASAAAPTTQTSPGAAVAESPGLASVRSSEAGSDTEKQPPPKRQRQSITPVAATTRKQRGSITTRSSPPIKPLRRSSRGTS